MLTGQVQDKRYREGELEYKVTQMELLAEILNKSKQLTLSVNLADLNGEFLNKLRSLVAQNKGNSSLTIEVRDEGNKKIIMPSKSLKITPSPEFLKALNDLNTVRYALN